jgi:hypothetical protein
VCARICKEKHRKLGIVVAVASDTFSVRLPVVGLTSALGGRLRTNKQRLPQTPFAMPLEGVCLPIAKGLSTTFFAVERRDNAKNKPPDNPKGGNNAANMQGVFRIFSHGLFSVLWPLGRAHRLPLFFVSKKIRRATGGVDDY